MTTQTALPDPEEIRQRWSDAREGAPSMATMNFLVYFENPEFRAWVVDRAQKIADKHPSRMIVLDATPGNRGVSVHTVGEPGVAPRERVDIGVDGVRAAERVHLVESLCNADLPVVMWWAADRLFSSNTFQALLPKIDHAILDSSGSGSRDPDAVREYANFFQREHGCAFRDLAWMRLEPWRDAVAQFFDDPALREELFSIRKLEIVSGSDAEALYLGGWLGSQLGWTACDPLTFCDRLDVKFSFERSREGRVRFVKRIRLTTETSQYTADAEGDDAVGLEITGKNAQPVRHVPLQFIDNAALIERGLLDRSHDEVFEKSLRLVGQLLQTPQ